MQIFHNMSYANHGLGRRPRRCILASVGACGLPMPATPIPIGQTLGQRYWPIRGRIAMAHLGLSPAQRFVPGHRAAGSLVIPEARAAMALRRVIGLAAVGFCPETGGRALPD